MTSRPEAGLRSVMLAGAEKSQDTFSFLPSVQQSKVALGVHKDSAYTNTIMSLHSQDREHTHQVSIAVSPGGKTIWDAVCLEPVLKHLLHYLYFQD